VEDGTLKKKKKKLTVCNDESLLTENIQRSIVYGALHLYVGLCFAVDLCFAVTLSPSLILLTRKCV
jgi:hypothetical protein